MTQVSQDLSGLLWAHELAMPKYRRLLEDPEVSEQLKVANEELRAMFSKAGFHIGRMSQEFVHTHLEAGFTHTFEMKDAPCNQHLGVTHIFSSDYRGCLESQIILFNLEEYWSTSLPVKKVTLLALKREAFQLNWQVALDADRYSRQVVIDQLRDQQFFEKDVLLPPSWVNNFLDALVQ